MYINIYTCKHKLPCVAQAPHHPPISRVDVHKHLHMRTQTTCNNMQHVWTMAKQASSMANKPPPWRTHSSVAKKTCGQYQKKYLHGRTSLQTTRNTCGQWQNKFPPWRRWVYIRWTLWGYYFQPENIMLVLFKTLLVLFHVMVVFLVLC